MEPHQIVLRARTRDTGVFIVDREWRVPDAAGLWEVPHLVIRTIDGFTCDTEHRLLQRFGDVLGFPKYYGRNWDAFSECLTDHEFTPCAATVLIVNAAERFLQRERKSRLAIFARIMNRVAAGLENSGYQHMEEEYQPYFWVLLRLPGHHEWREFKEYAPLVEDLRDSGVVA